MAYGLMHLGSEKTDLETQPLASCIAFGKSPIICELLFLHLQNEDNNYFKGFL